MLNADTSIPNTYASMGTFGDILHHVLATAASRVPNEIRIDHEVFDVVRQEYPASIADFDAIIITASSAASYDQEPWIRTLEAYLLKVYVQRPDVKIFGSCFGHHLVCQALLREYGVRVEPHPNGWEVGVSSVNLTEAFWSSFTSSTCRLSHDKQKRSARSLSLASQGFGRLPTPEAEEEHCLYDFDLTGRGNVMGSATAQKIPRSIRLQFVHEDQVILPAQQPEDSAAHSLGPRNLPEPWILVGSTEHCAVQGVYYPGRVLTLQGHFEFDKFENRQTMRIFGAEDCLDGDGPVSGQSQGDSHSACEEEKEAPDDGELMAEMVVQFLASRPMHIDEDEASVRRVLIFGNEQPLTPRSSMEII